MTDLEQRIAELERSHAELRGALLFAGRRINQLRRNDRSLAILRKVLKEARAAAKSKAATVKARIKIPLDT